MQVLRYVIMAHFLAEKHATNNICIYITCKIAGNNQLINSKHKQLLRNGPKSRRKQNQYSATKTASIPLPYIKIYAL